jgi:hypothetical protein
MDEYRSVSCLMLKVAPPTGGSRCGPCSLPSASISRNTGSTRTGRLMGATSRWRTTGLASRHCSNGSEGVSYLWSCSRPPEPIIDGLRRRSPQAAFHSPGSILGSRAGSPKRPAGWPRRIASTRPCWRGWELFWSWMAGRDARTRLCAASSLVARIKQIEMQLTQIDAAIASKVAEDEAMSRKLAILISIPGIGEATALSMLVEMPELGRLEGKQAASLASLAPISRQSGTWQGAAEGWRSPQIAARRGRGAGLRARPGRRGPRRARGSRGGRRRRRGRRSGGSRPGARRRARREGAAAGGRTPPSGRLHGAGGGGSCGCCEGASWLSSSRRRCPGRGRGGAGSCRRGRRGASGGGGRSPRAPTRACRGGWRRFRTGGVRGARASRRRARDGRTRCRRRDRCRGAGPGRGRHGSGGRRRRRSPRGAGAGAASGCRGSARSGARGRGCRRAGSRAMDREAGGRRYCVML